MQMTIQRCEPREWDRADESVVAPGDEHDRGVESLCVGEAR